MKNLKTKNIVLVDSSGVMADKIWQSYEPDYMGHKQYRKKINPTKFAMEWHKNLFNTLKNSERVDFGGGRMSSMDRVQGRKLAKQTANEKRVWGICKYDIINDIKFLRFENKYLNNDNLFWYMLCNEIAKAGITSVKIGDTIIQIQMKPVNFRSTLGLNPADYIISKMLESGSYRRPQIYIENSLTKIA